MTINNMLSIEEDIRQFKALFDALKKEISKVIVGNEEIIHLSLTAIFAGGHVLLEGAPGLGKTRLVRTIADTLGLTFKRIQFTPDLMPSDITGTQVLSEDQNGRRFIFKKGPVFANVVLADEINRATPKTQSALLEAMEEKQVTVLGETYPLELPFFVLATQNPIELEGTYPLPEAQLDRFIMKLELSSPTSDNLKKILDRTTGSEQALADTVLNSTSASTTIEDMKKLVRKAKAVDPLLEIIARIVYALTPNSKYSTDDINTYVKYGPGPRGAQSILLCAKVQALLDERINVSLEDVKKVTKPCLRHRLLMSFQAEADGVQADDLIELVLNAK